MKFRTAYGPHDRVTFLTTGPSLTHQAMSQECDINRIMAKYQKTGILDHRNTFQGMYGDYTETPVDYQESLNAVIQAEEMFSSLPASVRKRFQNDPGSFIDFVADPENKDELVRLGLTKPVEPLQSGSKSQDAPTPPKNSTAPQEPKKPVKEAQEDS